MTKRQTLAGGEREEAFTLIELLVVIAIIAVLAALIVPLSGIATTKMRLARTQAELNSLITGIDGYKLEVGFYPPDNGSLRTINTNSSGGYAAYRKALAMHPLVYELTGCLFTNRQFYTVGGDESITPALLKKMFEVEGIQNSQRRRADIPYKGYQLKPSMYADLKRSETDNYYVKVLAAPVLGPDVISGEIRRFSPWYYDATSTNRNNKASFDLWAEVIAGGKTNIIGNWKN
jgi:prepilin-type N-terminal cleavage/methylation domain-containing protein